MSFRSLFAPLAGVILATSTAFALPNEDFQGQPAFTAGDALGAFVWHDADGQHVRFTTHGKVVRHFKGKVCGTAVANVARYQTEDGDSVAPGPEAKCVLFDFKVDGGVDGFDFRADGDVVTYDFHMDGKQMPTELIRIGASSKNPNKSPFVLNRK